MKKGYDYIEDEFDDYIDSNMTAEDKKAFEARLASDPTLREEFAFHQSIRDGLRRSAAQPLFKQEVAEVRRNMLLRGKGNWFKRFRWYFLIAAFLLLLIVVGVWLLGPTAGKHLPVPNNAPPNSPQIEDSQQRQPDIEPVSPSMKAPPFAEAQPGSPEKPFVPEEKPADPGSEKEFPAAASQNEAYLKGSIPVKKVVFRNGKLEISNDTLTVAVEVKRDAAAEVRYRFFEGQLKIYTALPEELLPSRLGIATLQYPDSEPRFYLKNDGTWHRILSDSKTRLLKPETDENIIRLLEQH